MPGHPAQPVHVTARQEALLRKLVRGTKSAAADQAMELLLPLPAECWIRYRGPAPRPAVSARSRRNHIELVIAGPDLGPLLPPRRPVLVAGCHEPRVDPGDGQRPEIQHGAPAFLIGFRRADKQPAGAVRFRLHVPNIERGHLGHPQQPIACNRQQGGVAEAGDRGRAIQVAEERVVSVGMDGSSCTVRFVESHLLDVKTALSEYLS